MTPHTHTAAAILPDQRAASPVSNLPQADAGAFSKLKARLADQQRQADDLAPKGGRPAKRGFNVKCASLRMLKCAVIDAENKLNRN